MGDESEPTTGELHVEQVRRELEERDLAEKGERERAEQHARRADKAAYLKQKLAERDAAERRANREDESR